MASQSLPPEIRPIVAGLGARIWNLQQKIEQLKFLGATKMLIAAEAELEMCRKQRRDLRGW